MQLLLIKLFFATFFWTKIYSTKFSLIIGLGAWAPNRTFQAPNKFLKFTLKALDSETERLLKD